MYAFEKLFSSLAAFSLLFIYVVYKFTTLPQDQIISCMPSLPPPPPCTAPLCKYHVARAIDEVKSIYEGGSEVSRVDDGRLGQG